MPPPRKEAKLKKPKPKPPPRPKPKPRSVDPWEVWPDADLEDVCDTCGRTTLTPGGNDMARVLICEGCEVLGGAAASARVEESAPGARRGSRAMAPAARVESLARL